MKAWLEQRTSAVVMYHPKLPHAGFLMDWPWQQQIMQQLLPLLDHAINHQQQQQQQQQLTLQQQQQQQPCDVSAVQFSSSRCAAALDGGMSPSSATTDILHPADGGGGGGGDGICHTICTAAAATGSGNSYTESSEPLLPPGQGFVVQHHCGLQTGHQQQQGVFGVAAYSLEATHAR